MTITAKAPAPSDEIYCISYLRGLAALGVVLHHVRIDLWIGFNAIHDDPSLAHGFSGLVSWLSLPTIFMGSGVMLFFVISGFCIHYPYAGHHGKKLDLAEYGVRRLFRIYPPYLAAVVFAFAIQWIGYHYGFLHDLDGRNYLLSTLMLQNFLGGQPACDPALWTIPIEVAFYIFYPLVLIGLRRFPLGILGLGLAISLLAIGSSLLAPIQYNFLPYWFTWISGAALAEQYKKGLLRQPPLGTYLAAIFFFVLGLLCVWHTRAGSNVTGTRSWDNLIELTGSFAQGIAFSVLVWWAISNQSLFTIFPTLLHKALMYLGAVSYSLYLFHMPFFSLCGWVWTSALGEKPVNYLIVFPFVLLAVGVAGMAYLFIEAPAHLTGRKLASLIKSRHANR